MQLYCSNRLHLQWSNWVSKLCWTKSCVLYRLLTTVTREVVAARSLPVCHSSAAPQLSGRWQLMTVTLRTLALQVTDSLACPAKVRRFSNIWELSVPLSLHCFSLLSLQLLSYRKQEFRKRLLHFHQKLTYFAHLVSIKVLDCCLDKWLLKRPFYNISEFFMQKLIPWDTGSLKLGLI